MWEWSDSCTKAFKKINEMMTSDQALVHYDPEKPVTLATDASPNGLGAVLSHTVSDGSEKPIVFASRTLDSTEKKYSHIRKEVPHISTFHPFDRSPLVSIFHPEEGVPVTTAARLQR